MSKGKRYSGDEKLNYTKVLAVVIALIVILMFILIVKNLISKAITTKNVVSDYYALYSNDKWGILDSTGNIVIDPMYQEMIIVLNKTKDVFLCTYDIDEENGTYKTKVINKNNEEIFTQYDKIEALENFDSNENVWYEQDLLKVEKDGKYGLINLDGKEILSINYDEINTLKGTKNSIIIKKDGKYGLVNNSGTSIIDTSFSKIEAISENYKDGYITIDENKKYGLINYLGKQILENKYEEIYKIAGENYTVIKKDGKQQLIDNNGKVIINSGYDKITQINSDGIIFVKDKKYGFMGFDGKTKIKPEYQELKEINSGILSAKKDNKYGIIDITGEEKIKFEYENIYYDENAGIYVAENSEYNSSIIDSEFNIKLTGILSTLDTEKGYMKLRINDEYKYYNFKFEEKDVKEILTNNTLFVIKQNGKYGFANKDGKIIVDCIYDEALEQNSYGYAAIKKDSKWGVIDSEGNVVQEPKYELTNNLVIDFIGKWHLGQDLNMNYYCEF